jgi:hypothetical protein
MSRVVLYREFTYHTNFAIEFSRDLFYVRGGKDMNNLGFGALGLGQRKFLPWTLGWSRD